MYQSFEASTSPDQGPPRLARLRAAMEAADLDCFIVPRADAHQGEYVAPCDERLAWLTGFTGSAGFCVALMDKAAVFIDGRYTVQVKAQVDTDHFTPVDWPKTKAGAWIAAELGTGRIGFDPWLFTKSQIDEIENDLSSGSTLVPCDNLVDRIWDDRPERPRGEAEAYPIELSGMRSPDKRQLIADKLRESGQASAVLSLPDSICWMLNIRGSDIARIPVVQCFAIIHASSAVDLFVEPGKVAPLGPDPAITVHAPTQLAEVLKSLSGPVRIDKGSAPFAILQVLEDAGIEIAFGQDPCILPKACKNDTEIEGTRAAHLRDAVAMVEFLAWLDAQSPGTFTEIDVVTSLEGFRRKTNALRDISFETISGAGANGAVVHYRVTQETNRTVEDGQLLLVDSGGQYVDGTTDITRTIAIGTPSREQQECFTRVLQGMIAISLARFPRGLSGRDLDALARAPLWRAGMDYDHGTGHGVGTYLSVHEGPQRLSRVSEVPLKPGMILSNEPGYYREGAFGIRIENLIVVREAAELGDNRDMLDFETLTWVPIDRRLIAADILAPHEIEWINAYHAEIRDKLDLEGDCLKWVLKATEPL